MRLIPSLVQQKLFQVVRDRFESGLREAKLPVAVEDLRVISGSEEGFWGFVAAAVLTKKAKLDANGELVVVRGIKEGLLARVGSYRELVFRLFIRETGNGRGPLLAPLHCTVGGW